MKRLGTSILVLLTAFIVIGNASSATSEKTKYSGSPDKKTGVLTLADSRGSKIKSVAYDELKALITGSLLSIGQTYRISDYRTRHTIPNTTDVNVGPTEPLIVTAASTSKLSSLAYSESYPQDIIHYEFVDSSTAGGDRGRILYRKDTKWNIAMHEDWRHTKYRRWETRRGSGKYWVNHAPGLERRVVIAGSGDTIVLQHNIYYPIRVGDSFAFNGALTQYTVTSIKDGEPYGYPGHDAITSAGNSFPRIIPRIDPTDYIEYRYRDTPTYKDMLIMASQDPGSNSIHSIEIGKTTLSPDQLSNSVILSTTTDGAQAHDVRCGSNFYKNTNSGNSMIYVTSVGNFIDNIFNIFALEIGFNFNYNIITDTAEVRSSRLGTNFMRNVLDYGLISYISVIDDFAYNTLTGSAKTGQSQLEGLNFGENIFNNHWHSARFLENDLAGGEFNLNRISKSNIVQNTIGSHFNNSWIHADIKNSEIGPNITDVDFGTLSYDGRVLQSGRSNFYADVDISGLAALDISPNNAKYAGIINVKSGNAKETIKIVLNAPGSFPVRIMPAAGLMLTFTGTPYASINADGQILLNVPSRVLDGNKRDSIELERTTVTNGNGKFTVVREKSVQIGM